MCCTTGSSTTTNLSGNELEIPDKDNSFHSEEEEKKMREAHFIQKTMKTK